MTKDEAKMELEKRLDIIWRSSVMTLPPNVCMERMLNEAIGFMIEVMDKRGLFDGA